MTDRQCARGRTPPELEYECVLSSAIDMWGVGLMLLEAVLASPPSAHTYNYSYFSLIEYGTIIIIGSVWCGGCQMLGVVPATDRTTWAMAEELQEIVQEGGSLKDGFFAWWRDCRG
jgi:hypothetical protein